jgi:hypothetical protein
LEKKTTKKRIKKKKKLIIFKKNLIKMLSNYCKLKMIFFPKKCRFFNGLPLAFSSRIRTIHDFGYVALEFAHLLAEDSGTYTCRTINDAGEAESSITIGCDAKRNLYLESQHEQSWAKIQEMENREMAKEPSPELHFPPPTFIVPLESKEDLTEGDQIRLECRLQPVNDPTLKVRLFECLLPGDLLGLVKGKQIFGGIGKFD